MSSAIESKLRYMARQYTNGSVARGGQPTKHYLEKAADRIATLERELAEAKAREERLHVVVREWTTRSRGVVTGAGNASF